MGAQTSNVVRLPKSMRPLGLASEILRQTGIVTCDGDSSLFCRALLPPGWRVIPDRPVLWMRLDDPRGRERAFIFTGERDPFLVWTQRYTYTVHEDGESEVILVAITDCGRVIHQFDPLPFPDYHRIHDHDRDHKRRRAHQIALNWLDAHFPDWQNPAAYWD